MLTGVGRFPEVGTLFEVRFPREDGMGTLRTKVLVGTAADTQASDHTVPQALAEGTVLPFVVLGLVKGTIDLGKGVGRVGVSRELDDRGRGGRVCAGRLLLSV